MVCLLFGFPIIILAVELFDIVETDYQVGIVNHPVRCFNTSQSNETWPPTILTCPNGSTSPIRIPYPNSQFSRIMGEIAYILLHEAMGYSVELVQIDTFTTSEIISLIAGCVDLNDTVCHNRDCPGLHLSLDIGADGADRAAALPPDAAPALLGVQEFTETSLYYLLPETLRACPTLRLDDSTAYNVSAGAAPHVCFESWQTAVARLAPAAAVPCAAAAAADPAAGPRNRPIWDNPIWAHPESRWLLVQFIVSLVLFHALHLSFPFLLPLLGMRLGFDDGDVALLVALPPAAGLLLFWLGSAFADENYVARGAVAGAGLAAGYWCAAAAASFFDLFVAAFVFAVAACYSCNLVRARARARLVRARVLRACVRVRGCVLARRKPAGSGRWEKARGTGIRPAARPTGRPQ